MPSQHSQYSGWPFQLLQRVHLCLPIVPIVLNGHAATAPKSTRLIQDGDRYIFLVEDNRNSKVSSVPLGTDAQATKATDVATDVGGNQEEGEEETGENALFWFESCFQRCLWDSSNEIRIMVMMTFIAFHNKKNAYYSSRFKSPLGIDRDAMRFQGLGAILLWLAHLASISHDKPRHCAAVNLSNAPT